MPDIWLDVDANVTAPVNLLPLLDDTDFKTREVAIAYNASGMDLVWNFITTSGAITQTAVTPTTGGEYDWSHVGDGIYKIEIPASGGASIHNDTEGFGWFTGFVTGVLPWRGPVIGFRAAGLNNALIDSAWSTTRGLSGTALPDAAADAAGGLPISDAGGLDLDAQIGSDIDAILVDTSTTLDDLVDGLETMLTDIHDTDLPAVKTDTAAIKAKTDNLPGTPADEATLTAIKGSTWTSNAHLQNIYANVITVRNDTDELQIDLTDGGRIDLLIDAIKAKTDQLAFTVANQVDANALTGGGGGTAEDIADAVWDESAAGHLTPGTTGAALGSGATAANVWAYGSRTLTMTPQEIEAAVVEGSVIQTRGNDWTIAFTGLSFNGTNMQFAIKADPDQVDSAANLLIDEGGLRYLNGTAQAGAEIAKATMTYNDGTLTITVKASITAQLDPGIYHYGIQDISAQGIVNESYIGEFTITADVVRGTT